LKGPKSYNNAGSHYSHLVGIEARTI